MPSQPRLIVDLHTHLFNARCLPLPGIIANAMGKDAGESHLARAVANFLYRLTEAEYRPQPTNAFMEMDSVEYFVDQLCDLTADELVAPFRENFFPTRLVQEILPAEDFDLIHKQVIQSDLHACLSELEEVLLEEGYIEPAQNMFMGVGDITGWAKKIVAVTFNTLEKLIILRDEITNYAEFFFNMLHAEEHMAHTLIKDYGDQLPPLQIVHHMMDMQMAYVAENTPASMVAPKYAFNETQLLRMQDLARHNQGKIFGFAAFDPRRPDWRDIVEKSIAMGFKGFKFYPALGYLPIGNKDAMGNDDFVIEQRVLDFFRLCIERKMPVFTHCTPTGFQTRFKKGLNASPIHWEKLLSSNSGEFAQLRLCFGHAGGGDDNNNGFHSPGWTASSVDWESANNYAYTVARLCRTYEHVYCEFAYLTEFIEETQVKREAAINRFEANLIRAIKPNPGEPYDFSGKICYGSDWHMPSMVKHPRAYLNIFLDMFDDNKPLAELREQFFWGNAYAYLGMSMRGL